MFDKDFLTYAIKNRGYTIEGFIPKLNMSKSLFYTKLREPSKFTYPELCKIQELLKLNGHEMLSIFFKNIVA